MDIFVSFLGEFVVAVVMLVIGWFARIAYQRYRTTRPAQKVWQFNDDDTVLIVTPNPTGYVEGEFSDTVFPTDYMAIAELQRFLNTVYPGLRIIEYFAQEFPSQGISEHVVLVGGDDINPLTEMMLKRLRPAKLPLTFENDHITERHKDGKVIFKPEVLFDSNTRRNEIIKDYAIVIGQPNPFEQKKRLYILAGCYVHGNLAAVHSMIDPMIRTIAKELDSHQQFVLLVKALVLRRYIGSVEIVRFYVYDEMNERWIQKLIVDDYDEQESEVQQ